MVLNECFGILGRLVYCSIDSPCPMQRQQPVAPIRDHPMGPTRSHAVKRIEFGESISKQKETPRASRVSVCLLFRVLDIQISTNAI